MIYSVFKFNSKRSCYEGLKYLTCVQCQDLTRIEQFYTRGRQSPILGGEDFRERVREKIGKIGGEHPRHERVWLRPSVEEVVSNVAGAYGTRVRWRRGSGSEAGM